VLDEPLVYNCATLTLVNRRVPSCNVKARLKGVMKIRSVIRSVAHYVPSRRVTNDELALYMDTTDEWIRERTGIKERRFVEDSSVSTTDLAEAAAKDALARAGWQAKEVDLIIAATLSPDYYFPGIGVLLQKRLACGSIPALDVRAQCSGLVYGLACVDGFIKSLQAKKVLLVCAEVQSPVLDLSTRGREMAVLFGDGAGALCIEASEEGVRGILDTVLGSDGRGADVLCMKLPGTATPGFITESHFKDAQVHPFMDGKVVFKNAVTRLLETATSILQRNNLSPDDIDLLVPHQANMRINEMVRAQLGLPESKVFNNIERYGNTTAATIPICLSEAVAEGRLREGMTVVTLAFGAGFTWGGNLIRW
jgi:3-oxoacyl-[acyl-carrier-protein] synthase-3